MLRISATRPFDSASGESRTRGAGVLPGAEMLDTMSLLQDRASLLAGVVTAKYLTAQPRRRWLVHSGATVLDSHQLPSGHHAIGTVKGARSGGQPLPKGWVPGP